MKLLLVDGYNVLRSGSRYRDQSYPDYTDEIYNQMRERLISDVASFAGNEFRAIIVYDGAQNEFSAGEAERIGGIEIIFSPAGQSADKVIEKLAREAREHGTETLVVTSDGTVQDTVFGGGVDRMSANDFCWEIDHLVEEAQEDEQHRPAPKNTLGERLDPRVLEKLARLRDGR